MSKAKDYIEAYTKRCSNKLVSVESKAGKEVISYHEWLTPENALAAVEIAKEEWLEKALDFFGSNYNSLVDGGVIGVFDDKEKMIEEFEEFMKGEE